MKKGRRLTGVILSAFMAMTLLAGCGGGEAAGPEESGAVLTPGRAEEASCIKIGVSGTPDLDPAIVNTGSSLIAAVNLYDTLVFPSAEEASGVAGRAAQDWEISDDGMKYTFHLKQGIRFHNGEEMKASDVAYSMDRLLTIGEGYAYIFSNYLEPGSTVAVDDYTVEFHLKQAYGPFLNALIRLFIVSEKEVREHTEASGNYGENGDYPGFSELT